MASDPQLMLRLFYLPVRARAEAIRMMLAYGKVPYHDVVIPFDRFRILKGKKSFPFSQLPVLQVLVHDSHVKLKTPPLREISIAQSGSITRFLAPRVGLQPEDPYEAALCDSYYEASQDMARVNPIVNIYVGEQLESEKKKFLKQLPGRLEDIARILEGKEEKQFLLGDRPFYCDMNMFHTLQQVLVLKPDALDQYPALRKYVNNVAALSGVKEYLERRPMLEDLGKNLLYGQRKKSEGEGTEVDKTDK